MIKSPIGKYNILPKNNFIDVAINDGDEITALEYFKDKLLQFKKRKVFIINVSGDYEFLEDTFDNVGVSLPFQVTKTPYGIVWVNSKGCFIYDGSKLTNLIKDKIPNDDIVTTTWYWNASDSLDEMDRLPSVGFNGKTNEIIVKRGQWNNSTGANLLANSDGFVYSFNTNAWYTTYKSLAFLSTHNYSPKLSNFTTTSAGELICYGWSDGTDSGYDASLNNINKWVHAQATDVSEGFLTQYGSVATSQNAVSFYTKIYDLGNIARQKKIYKVIVDYKSPSADSKISVTAILTHHKDTYSASIFDNIHQTTVGFDTSNSLNYTSNGLIQNTGTGKDMQAHLIPSSGSKLYFNNAFTIQLVFSDVLVGSANLAFEIKDITIIYRNKALK
tara:strand:- start:3521 stop:4681 length:1161 start_codon:yes stop_codon:yes gene_type:complete